MQDFSTFQSQGCISESSSDTLTTSRTWISSLGSSVKPVLPTSLQSSLMEHLNVPSWITEEALSSLISVFTFFFSMKNPPESDTSKRLGWTGSGNSGHGSCSPRVARCLSHLVLPGQHSWLGTCPPEGSACSSGTSMRTAGERICTKPLSSGLTHSKVQMPECSCWAGSDSDMGTWAELSSG